MTFDIIVVCGGGFVFGEGSLCETDNTCIQVLCSIKAKIGHFIERLEFLFEHDICNRDIWIGINGHVFNISYKGSACTAMLIAVKYNI